ncbi:MAG: aminopeptidase [Cyclobacteriaceae bacterium]
MKHIKGLVIVCALFFIYACNEPQKETKVDGFSLDLELIADKLISQSQLQSGERVLLVGQPGQFEELVPLLQERIEGSGAIFLGARSIDDNHPETWQTEFTTFMDELGQEALANYLKDVDLGIMLPGATPANETYAALQKVLSEGKGRTIHFHWQGAYDLNGNLFEPDQKVDSFYQHVLLNTDYTALAKSQLQFDSAMRGNWIQVTTPAGTDIMFQIGDRQVTKQDGNASMDRMSSARTLIDREVELPAGAIRVAPIEESVSGKIAFPDAMWDGQLAEGVVITIVGGQVTEITATKNIEAVERELDKGGEGARSFREFALGFNPLLAIPSDNPWIPYYGYGAGVVRLSLGDNSELGGNVSGGYVRWNFFADATVKVGEDVWVEQGKLVR